MYSIFSCLLDGLLIGAIFALAAYGLALVWGVMNVKNLCQGEFVIMGGYFAWIMANLGLHPILALPIAIVVMFVFGWVVYLTIIKRVVAKDMFTSLSVDLRAGDRHPAGAEPCLSGRKCRPSSPTWEPPSWRAGS